MKRAAVRRQVDEDMIGGRPHEAIKQTLGPCLCGDYGEDDVGELDAHEHKEKRRGAPHAVDHGEEALAVVVLTGGHPSPRQLDHRIFRQLRVLLVVALSAHRPDQPHASNGRKEGQDEEKNSTLRGVGG